MIEVLELERLVLLNETANLGYRVKALVEENKGLASESMFCEVEGRELAKCVVKMREDHRFFLLHQKIEDLQARINGLEKRNKEYYKQLLVRDNKDKMMIIVAALRRRGRIVIGLHWRFSFRCRG